MKQKTYSIYALQNSVTNEVGYIGKTNDISKRFKEHISEARINDIKLTQKISNPRKVFWIHSNIDNLVIDELESGILSAWEAEDREVFYIVKLSKEGHNLTNCAGISEVRFNRKSPLVFDRYPGGYFIASGHKLDWYLLGNFLLSRDYFYDLYLEYTKGQCEFKTLQYAYERMLKCKELTQSSAKGQIAMKLGCGGKITARELSFDYPNRDLPHKIECTLLIDRNSCARIYSKSQNKFTWNTPYLKLCAISVGSNGKRQCKSRTITDFENELQISQLGFETALQKHIQSRMSDLRNYKIDESIFKKFVDSIQAIRERYNDLKKSFDSEIISIKNFLIQSNNLLSELNNC